MIESFCINLNIHYSISDESWNAINKIYQNMPHWVGYVDNIPTWYGKEDKVIEVSVEPSGLQVAADLSEDEWVEWLSLFKKRLTEQLKYDIGEPEDGYEFKFDI